MLETWGYPKNSGKNTFIEATDYIIVSKKTKQKQNPVFVLRLLKYKTAQNEVLNDNDLSSR